MVSVAWAEKEAYEIVMSKDDTLCGLVRDTLNKDLAAYGEPHYSEHQQTPAVQWRRMAELPSSLEDEDGEQFHWARLDFNNDGKQDLVVQHTWHLFGDTKITRNAFYFFESSHQGLRPLRTRQEFFKSLKKAGFGGGLKLKGYWLPKSFPKQYLEPAPQINLFTFGSSSYLHIVPTVGLHIVAQYTREAFPPPPYDEMKWNWYKADGNPIGLVDVCQMRIKASDTKESEHKTGEKRSRGTGTF